MAGTTPTTRGLGAGARRRAAGVALVPALVLAAACGRSHPDLPRPTSITPDHGSPVVPVPVRIRGEGFGAQVNADLAGGGGVVDARFQARLGETALDDVALQQDGSIAATVPVGMAAGTYDLTVVGPDGSAGSLPQAYTVAAPGGTAARVARFVVDVAGTQVARRPFTVTVTAVDAGGAVVADFTGTASLSDLGGTAVPARVGLFSGGRWTGAVELRAPHAANVLAVTDAGGVTGRSASFEVWPAPAARVGVDAATASATAGQCTGPVTLSLLDAFGQPTDARTDTALGATSAPGAGFALFADGACGSPQAAPVVPAGQGAASVWFTETVAGPLRLTASGASLAPAERAWSVAAGPPATLSFVTTPQRVGAGACSGDATVEVLDAFGNPSPDGVAALDLAAAPAGGFELYADAACTTPATSLTVPVGATRASFRFRGTAAGPVSVGASAPGLAAASQDQAVTPGAASVLAFVTPARAARARACSAAVTLEARDGYGNPSPGAALPVDLVAGPGNSFHLHADASCQGAPASAVVIPAGASQGTFHFKGTARGQFPVTASAAGVAAATQTERVDPGDPAAIVFASAPQVVAAHACSGALTLSLADADGNVAPPVADVAVAIDASPAAGFGIFADAGCTVPLAAVTVPAGGTTADFHFTAARVGPVDLTASAGGLTPATQTETVRATAPIRLAFASAAQTVTAGSCSAPAILEARDADGNPSAVSVSAPTAVALSGAGLALYAGAGCAGAPVASVTLAAGATAVTFSFRATAAATVPVTASAGGLSPDTQTETISPGAATRLAFVTSAQTVQAGTCSGAVTLEAQDAFGNPSAVSASAATIVTLAGGALTSHAAAGCGGGGVTSVALAAGATAVTFSFDATLAGTATLTASAGALTPAAQTETITPASPAQLAFRTGAQTVTAGTCSSAAVVELRDTYGNPSPSAAARTVGLAAAGLTFHAGAGCTGTAVTWVNLAAGATTATFSFTGTAAGAAVVTANVAGVTAVTQTETVAPAAATLLAYTTGTQTVAAGSCSAPVTVEARDALGNPSPPSAAASTPVPLVGAGLVFFAGAGCAGGGTTQVSIAAGASGVTFWFRGTAAGTVGVTASAAGLSSTTQYQTVVAGALDRLAWAAIASPQVAGTPFAVGLSARDAYGNLVPGFTGTATLSASAGTVGCTTSCTAPGVTAAFAAGQWSGTVTAPSAATAVTLGAAGAGVTGTSNAFDVQGAWAPRSPPLATFTVTPPVVVSGSAVTFDASASSDRQTPSAALEVAWDLDASGYAGYASTAAPPASPWTAWTTAKTATHAYINNGTAAVVVRPRVAVRDGETGPGGPDVGYAGGLVVVLPNGNDLCVVDTASLADDGATGCHGPGPDGVLSLTEAVRLANAWPRPLNITFAAPMTIAGATTLTLTRAARIVGIPGVVLSGVTLVAAADDVLLAGLELRNLTAPITVRSQSASDARLEGLVVHDGAGILVQGHGLLDRVRMYACAGTCVRQTGNGSYLGLWNSDLQGTGGDVGVAIDACASAMPYAVSASPYQAWTTGGWSTSGGSAVVSTVLSGFATGVSVGSYTSCAHPYLTNLTFDGNGIGARRDASAGAGGGLLLDGLFTNQTVAAIDPSACGFFLIARSAAFGNASAGCAAPDHTEDPLYVWRAGRDYRLQYGSPVKDQANGGNLVEVDGAGPGLWLGSAPDRGGRETY